MVRNNEPVYDEVITIPWGVGEVHGRVHEVYGRPEQRYVVVRLIPGLSGYIVADETTVTVPIDEVTRATSASGSSA